MDWKRLFKGAAAESEGAEPRAPEDPLARAREVVLAYHETTKHAFQRYARGPFELDWATQPDPFRRWEGAEVLPLAHVPAEGGASEPRYEQAFVEGGVAARPLDRALVSQLLLDSLALSAWKRAGDSRWSLRVNPSSGNLHPTEGYVVAPAVAGLSETPFVAHYAPREHALEVRARFDDELWSALAAELPAPCLLVGLSSIHWREAWKYGERAWRYCNHDVGHAIGCVALAAGGMGWTARLLDGVGSAGVARVLGLGETRAPEAEEPECLLALFPTGTPGPTGPTGPPGEVCTADRLPADAVEAFAGLDWRGRPNELSPDHVEWDVIELVADAVHAPVGAAAARAFEPPWPPLVVGDEPIPFRGIVHGRRSAVAMDGRSGLALDAFWQTLRRTLPGPGELPFAALRCAPRVHLALFVHRVGDLEPGLYLLVRNPADEAVLRADLREDFAWTKPTGCPEELPLFLLHAGDVRGLAARVSCNQDIAADGCFSLGMLARFASAIADEGPWTYPRLFWECGVVGQALYLEAEALGLSATGIGCFFDDPVHAVLGLHGDAWQSLYHFTIGGRVDDPRIQAEPAYAEPRE